MAVARVRGFKGKTNYTAAVDPTVSLAVSDVLDTTYALIRGTYCSTLTTDPKCVAAAFREAKKNFIEGGSGD